MPSKKGHQIGERRRGRRLHHVDARTAVTRLDEGTSGAEAESREDCVDQRAGSLLERLMVQMTSSADIGMCSRCLASQLITNFNSV